MDFGLTNDKARYEAAVAYFNAAIQDGWVLDKSRSRADDPTSGSLSKEGFSMLLTARPNTPPKRFAYQASVSIWGPDSLAIKPPDVYDWPLIQAGIRTCNECDAKDVDTERFSFAGRACCNCIEKARRRTETPGWTR